MDRERARAAEFEVINELHELATNVAERIGFPMNHIIDYEMVDGQAWCVTARMPEPMVEITGASLEQGAGMYYGVNAFQQERLRLEHEETMLVDQLFRGELGGNVMTVISRIPDAVARGVANIEGYRSDLMRGLVRVYYVSGDGGFRCRMFSIDQNDPAAMHALGETLGIEIAHGESSEVTLSRRNIMNMSSVSDEDIELLTQQAIKAHDGVLLRKTGAMYYAGSAFSTQEDALAMVKRHPWLLEECRQNIHIIESSGLSDVEKQRAIEAQIKKTTGAINASVDGYEVTSSSDGIAGDYAATRNYAPDCPTGPSALENVLSNQGKEIKMTCPHCGLTTVGDPCAFRLVCGMCEAEVRGGRLINKGIGRTAALARSVNRSNFGDKETDSRTEMKDKPKNSYDKAKALQQQLGDHAVVRLERAIGGQDIFVVDKTTNVVYQRF